ARVLDLPRRTAERRRRFAAAHRHRVQRQLEQQDRRRSLRQDQTDDAGAAGAAGQALASTDERGHRAHPERGRVSGGFDRAAVGSGAAETHTDQSQQPVTPLVLSLSKDEPPALMVRQAHHERLFTARLLAALMVVLVAADSYAQAPPTFNQNVAR